MIVSIILTIGVTIVIITAFIWCGICDDSGGEVFSENHLATNQKSKEDACIVSTKMNNMYQEPLSPQYSLRQNENDVVQSETNMSSAQVNTDAVADSDFIDFIQN